MPFMTMTEAELFTAFSVDLESFVRATNPQVGTDMQLDPSQFVGEELWNVSFSRSKYNEGALSSTDLARLQAAERTARVARMAATMASMQEPDDDSDFSLTDTIEKPLYI